MRSCTDNIARLEGSLAPGQPGIQNLNPHGLAHRHGVVSPSYQTSLGSRTCSPGRCPMLCIWGHINAFIGCRAETCLVNSEHCLKRCGAGPCCGRGQARSVPSAGADPEREATSSGQQLRPLPQRALPAAAAAAAAAPAEEAAAECHPGDLNKQHASLAASHQMADESLGKMILRRCTRRKWCWADTVSYIWEATWTALSFIVSLSPRQPCRVAPQEAEHCLLMHAGQ